MDNNYYYLLSSLPVLSLEKPGKIDLNLIFAQIQDNLSYEDSIYFDYLLLPNDHKNIVAHFGKYHQDTLFRTPALFDQEELKRNLRNPANFPEYIYQVFQEYPGKPEELSARLFEVKLMQGFYEITTSSDDDFISRYFQFDRDLRTILFEWNQRKTDLEENFKLPYEQLISTIVAEKLRLNQYDSLKLEYNWLESLQSLFNSGKLLEMEKLMDQVRWDFIESLTIGHYFDKQAVFAYFLQAQMVSRWAGMDAHAGNERLNEMKDKLREEFYTITE